MPFSFAHNLHRSKYFSDDAVEELVKRAAGTPGGFYVEDGDSGPGARWAGLAGDVPITEVWRTLHSRKCFVLLKRVHTEPGYREILDNLVADLSTLTGIDLPSHYRDGLITVILSSPHRVTPYHLDGEANLLMQIRGSKTAYIFDGNDREILPAQELERYWSGDIHAPTYREQFQSRAWSVPLEPGIGVTNPVAFPHWVKNGPEVSISVSVNFKRKADDSAKIHRVNGQFRKLGLHPSSPGSHPIVDHTKSNLYNAAYTIKKKIDGLRHPAH